MKSLAELAASYGYPNPEEGEIADVLSAAYAAGTFGNALDSLDGKSINAIKMALHEKGNELREELNKKFPVDDDNVDDEPSAEEQALYDKQTVVRNLESEIPAALQAAAERQIAADHRTQDEKLDEELRDVREEHGALMKNRKRPFDVYDLAGE